jgi:hypothetical protein
MFMIASFALWFAGLLDSGVFSSATKPAGLPVAWACCMRRCSDEPAQWVWGTTPRSYVLAILGAYTPNCSKHNGILSILCKLSPLKLIPIQFLTNLSAAIIKAQGESRPLKTTSSYLANTKLLAPPTDLKNRRFATAFS